MPFFPFLRRRRHVTLQFSLRCHFSVVLYIIAFIGILFAFIVHVYLTSTWNVVFPYTDSCSYHLYHSKLLLPSCFFIGLQLVCRRKLWSITFSWACGQVPIWWQLCSFSLHDEAFLWKCTYMALCWSTEHCCYTLHGMILSFSIRHTSTGICTPTEI